jgi:hypothetical protein
MKTFRSSFVLLLLLLGASAWWWSEQRPAREGERENGALILWRLDPESIRSFSLRSVSPLSLSRAGEAGSWSVERAAEGTPRVGKVPADASVVSDFLKRFGVLRAREVRPDASRLARAQLEQYGLAQAKLGLDIAGHELSWGTQAPSRELLVYARVKTKGQASAADRIVLLPLALREATQRPLEEWRDRRVLAFAPDAVASVSWALPSARLEVERAPGASPSSQSLWRLTAPVRARADASSVQSALSSLVSLEARAFWPRTSAQSAARPLAKVRVVMADGKAHEISIERRATASEVERWRAWARADDAPLQSGLVARSTRFPREEVLLPLEALDVWKRSVSDWRDKLLLAFALDEVSRLDIRFRGAGQSWRQSGKSWVRIIPTPQESGSSEANAVLDLLLASSNLRAVEARPLPSGFNAASPWLDISLGLPSGEHRLRLWREGAGSNLWLARLQGPSARDSARDEDARTLWVLPEEVIRAFEPGLNTLFPPAPKPRP